MVYIVTVLLQWGPLIYDVCIIFFGIHIFYDDFLNIRSGHLYFWEPVLNIVRDVTKIKNVRCSPHLR